MEAMGEAGRRGAASHPLNLVLVNMPFAAATIPSFALSQLTALVRRDYPDVHVQTLYFNHDFANYFGIDLYTEIAENLDHHVTGLGEWLFRAVAFPELPDNVDAYLRRYYRQPSAAGLRQTILEKRAGVADLCAELAEAQAFRAADVVGFTSMFAQTVPSLAIARLLKERDPEVVTLLGGANCETPMGTAVARNFEMIDYVFSGPALRTFPMFLDRMLEGRLEECDEIPGIVTRRNCDHPRFSKMIGAERDIDDFVEPVYADFVDSFTRKLSGHDLEPILFFETSRGCWWGERSHCTFCGLNGLTMAYRAMSADIAVEQFQLLFRYYPWCKTFFGVDNIMPLEYVRDVLPRLRPPPQATLFYEVKVNLSAEDLEQMARAQVTYIQPGVEALATSTLKLMRKGTTAFHNLTFLMNCAKIGIRPTWNLLVGFPGEEEEVYQKYVGDIQLLVHLPPPSGVYPVRFDRFSPYFNEAEAYGLDLHPLDYYGLVFPIGAEDRASLAYYFADHSFGAYMEQASRWIGKLDPLIARWRELWAEQERPLLRLRSSSGGMEVIDSRSGELQAHPITRSAAELLISLRKPRRLEQITRGSSPAAVEEDLALLRELGFLFQEGERMMSLVAFGSGAEEELSHRSLVAAPERQAVTASPS
jgi:ribosomal peptide maturation radical SAM protein 1